MQSRDVITTRLASNSPFQSFLATGQQPNVGFQQLAVHTCQLEASKRHGVELLPEAPPQHFLLPRRGATRLC